MKCSEMTAQRRLHQSGIIGRPRNSRTSMIMPTVKNTSKVGPNKIARTKVNVNTTGAGINLPPRDNCCLKTSPISSALSFC